MLAVVDTGPLYAVADADDEDHDRCRDALASPEYRLIVPALVVAEATYLIGTRLGARAEAAFLRSIGRLDIEPPAIDDWSRMAELVERYRNLPWRHGRVDRRAGGATRHRPLDHAGSS